MSDLEIHWSRLDGVAAPPDKADGRALFAIRPAPVKRGAGFQATSFGGFADPVERGPHLPMGRLQ